MAYKRKRSYKSSKRSFKRGRFRGYKTKKHIKAGYGYNTLVNKANAVMPAKFITRHTYNTPIVYSASGSTVTQQIFRGNSLYDPDQTGVGATASGYTNMTAFYSYSRTYASAIEFTIASTGSYPFIFFCVPVRTTTALTLASAKSYPYYKEVIVSASDGGSAVRKLYVYCKGKTIMDINDHDFEVIAANGSNPNQQWFWFTGVVSADGTNTVSCSVSSIITYYTEWSGFKANAT